MTAIEVITSVQRRRRWSRDEKLRIVAESAQPERTASQVARAHGIAPGQLFTWRRQLLSEALAGGVAGDGFVPVAIANEAAGMAPAASAAGGEGAIESHAGTLTTSADSITRYVRRESKSRAHPAACGRHVRTGIRQSMPSSSMPSCAGVSTTQPSAGDGHTKRPFSSRFANRHSPWPSHHSALSR